ncbi:alanyl-tRNA editing protein [Paludifilum halophilum]|uniref:Alanyl-tRNA editing protein n=1 Tax=Paludifilum halophilum TaxID=1642702 RepID=A0A235B870_9BACL|nr:alanyl-tRNA editing protein [Paludifilum halophilum]OYD08513.1 alanyl-tRNA editing protein [Paludifilum halophilum]
MTEKLYVDDPFLKETTARIKKISGCHMTLDRTIFYPEGGGQLGDRGWLGGYPVVDTQKHGGRLLAHPDFPEIKVDTEVVHILDQEPETLEEGSTVDIQIDWPRRYRLMRMHSASHLIYHHMFNVFGDMKLKSCRIGEDRGRFDFFTDYKFTREGLDEVEGLANEWVDQEIPIEMRSVAGEKEAKVWICRDLRIPCGGTHVSNTREIGKMSLKRRGKNRTTERVYIQLEDDTGNQP